MKHLFKAHVVLKQLRESKYHALCKTAHKLWIDIQMMACYFADCISSQDYWEFGINMQLK